MMFSVILGRTEVQVVMTSKSVRFNYRMQTAF